MQPVRPLGQVPFTKATALTRKSFQKINETDLKTLHEGNDSPGNLLGLCLFIGAILMTEAVVAPSLFDKTIDLFNIKQETAKKI